MQLRNAIYLVACHNTQVRHPHTLGFFRVVAIIDKRNATDEVNIPWELLADFCQELCINPVDDIEVTRQEALHKRHWPSFQGLWHQSVVCVRENLLTLRPSIVPRHSVFIDEKPHQFSNRNRRMRVV